MTYTPAVIAWFVLRARLQGLAFLFGAAGSFGAVFVFAAVGLWLVLCWRVSRSCFLGTQKVGRH